MCEAPQDVISAKPLATAVNTRTFQHVECGAHVAVPARQNPAVMKFVAGDRLADGEKGIILVCHKPGVTVSLRTLLQAKRQRQCNTAVTVANASA